MNKSQILFRIFLVELRKQVKMLHLLGFITSLLAIYMAFDPQDKGFLDGLPKDGPAAALVNWTFLTLVSYPIGSLLGRIWRAWTNAKVIYEDYRLTQKKAAHLGQKFSQRQSLSIESVGDYWRAVGEQAHITVVVSGKGGVGKSTIALGSMEYLSEQSKVLLVDFDLHNRGLFLKLLGENLIEGEFTTTQKELNFFKSNLDIEEDMRVEANLAHYRLKLSDLTYAAFIKYRERFCYVQEHNQGGAKVLRDFPIVQLGKDTSSLSELLHGPRAEFCYFLPSREGIFLGSEESRLNEAEIALFLKYLASWCYKSYAITEMIVDCHGALDWFMVGAILAADHVVNVTLPDLGAYSGILELIDQAKEARSKFDPPANDTLVINRCQDTDEFTIQELIKRFNKSKEDVVMIRQDDDLHRIMKRYRTPSIYRESSIYSKMKEIVHKGIKPPQQQKPEHKPEEPNVVDEKKGGVKSVNRDIAS
jgi:cellulose biosynthesis protein BcsQ